MTGRLNGTVPNWRRGFKLMTQDGSRELLIGETTTDFRGDAVTIVDYMAPLHDASTGRVVLRLPDGWEHPYFPGVINAKIVPIDPPNAIEID
jgi:hypothetical protein